MSLPIAIIAGGKATRLGTLTNSIPKILLPIKGRIFFDLQIENLIKSGFDHFVYCVNHLGDQIVRHYKDNPRKDIKVDFSFDGELSGTGGAILNARNYLGDKFFVTYGDSFLTAELTQFKIDFMSELQQSFMATILTTNHRLQKNTQVSAGRVVNYSKEFLPTLNALDYGILGINLNSTQLTYDAKDIDLTEIIEFLILSKKLLSYPVREPFYEIGSTEGIQEFSEYIEGHL